MVLKLVLRGGGGRIDYEAVVTVPSKNSLIAVGASEYPAFISHRISDTQVVVRVIATQPVTMTLYIFDKVFSVSEDNAYGIEAFNAAGEKTFSSARKYLKIIEVVNFYEHVTDNPKPHDGYYLAHPLGSVQNNLWACGIKAFLYKKAATEKKNNTTIIPAVLLDAPDFFAAYLDGVYVPYVLCMCMSALSVSSKSLSLYFDFLASDGVPLDKNWQTAIAEFVPDIYKVRNKFVIDVTGL